MAEELPEEFFSPTLREIVYVVTSTGSIRPEGSTLPSSSLEAEMADETSTGAQPLDSQEEDRPDVSDEGSGAEDGSGTEDGEDDGHPGPSDEPAPSRPRQPRAAETAVAEALQQLVKLQSTLIAYQEEERKDKLRQKQEENLRRQREDERRREEKIAQERERERQRQAEEAKRREDLLDVRKYDRKALPVYQISGDILTFLQNFQYACQDLQAPKAIWTKLLRTQVTGPLSDLLSEMAGTDWESFMARVRQRFGYTTEGLRVKVRSLKWSHKSSVAEFEAKVRREMLKWVESAGVKNLEDMLEVLISEQVRESLPSEINVSLLEKKIENAQDLAIEADNLLSYRLANKS